MEIQDLRAFRKQKEQTAKSHNSQAKNIMANLAQIISTEWGLG